MPDDRESRRESAFVELPSGPVSNVNRHFHFISVFHFLRVHFFIETGRQGQIRDKCDSLISFELELKERKSDAASEGEENEV